MTVGYTGAGRCWATSQEAIDATYSQPIPMFMNGTAIVKCVNMKGSGFWTTSCASGTGAFLPQGATLPTAIWGTCTLETSPGYPVPNPAPTTGGGTGTVTGTVTIAQPTYEYSSATAVAAWSIAFTTVLGMWWMAKNFGIVINAIRRW